MQKVIWIPVLLSTLALTVLGDWQAQLCVALGKKLFFAADNNVSGRELWKSDGTAAGTVLVKDIYQGSGSSYPIATSPR